ncbi:CMRF35-like molecule 6 [Hippoglossus stenolepis]|uniref:CMRF35-like molecule 6 n=1 Tax=Hippoglossus stenolepis TaxID=195615 RepID=UPI001FB00933|nr:CMRF35-like molecule 6 [Hippoglossus stenolepis]
MNAHLIFIFFFLTSLLQDGLTDSVYTGPEGGTITVSCLFRLSGEKKLFCRKSCGDGNVLIETDGVRAQSGRYSIEYEEGVFLTSHTFINVTIKQLRKSDSGNYTCRLKRTVRLDSTKRVEIIVTDASPSPTPNWTVEPSPTSFPAATAPTSNSPEPSEQSSALQITSVLLNVSFIIIIIITLSVTVMAFCRIRTNKHTG